jgi:hypothetical protein
MARTTEASTPQRYDLHRTSAGRSLMADTLVPGLKRMA